MPLPDFRLIRLLPLAALVLTACSVTTPKGPGKSPDSPQWRQHQQDVRNLNQYQTRGAFAYISDQQKVYARFFWQQTGQDRYRLLLTNPLGSTELELNAQPGNVQLVDNKGQRYTADDAEEMIGTKGNVTHAARMAGRNRTEFYKLLSRHELDANDFKE